MITLDRLGDEIKARIDKLIVLTPEKASQIGMEISQDMANRIRAGEAQPPSNKIRGYYINSRGIKRMIKMEPGEKTLLKSGDYADSFTGEYVDVDQMRIVNDSHVSPQWKVIKERTLSIINSGTLINAIKKVLLAK